MNHETEERVSDNTFVLDQSGTSILTVQAWKYKQEVMDITADAYLVRVSTWSDGWIVNKDTLAVWDTGRWVGEKDCIKEEGKVHVRDPRNRDLPMIVKARFYMLGYDTEIRDSKVEDVTPNWQHVKISWRWYTLDKNGVAQLDVSWTSGTETIEWGNMKQQWKSIEDIQAGARSAIGAI